MNLTTLPTIQIVSRSKAIVTIDGKSATITNLLASGDSNTKLAKNAREFYETRGFSMLPHRLGGIGNVCGFASAGCIAACLNSTGFGAVFQSVQFGRLCRRMLWHNERDWFLARLNAELQNATCKAHARGAKLAVRLNVFSDIPWEKTGIVDAHPLVEFYDYTKNPKRAGLVRPNYWVTFSRSETNEKQALDVLSRGGNVAAVFHNVGKFTGNRAGLQSLPDTYKGYPVISGDDTDLRFADPRGGYWVGLKLKAPNNQQRQSAIDSGFSIEA